MMRFFKGLLGRKQSVQEPVLLKPKVVEEPKVEAPVVETPPVEVPAPVKAPVVKSTNTAAAKPNPPRNSRSPKSGNAKPRKSKSPSTKA